MSDIPTGCWETTLELEGGSRFFFEAMVMAAMGRQQDALAILRECEQASRPEMMRTPLRSRRTLLEGLHSICPNSYMLQPDLISNPRVRHGHYPNLIARQWS